MPVAVYPLLGSKMNVNYIQKDKGSENLTISIKSIPLKDVGFNILLKWEVGKANH